MYHALQTQGSEEYTNASYYNAKEVVGTPPELPPAYEEHPKQFRGVSNPTYMPDMHEDWSQMKNEEVTSRGEFCRKRVVKVLPGFVYINPDVGSPDPVEEPWIKRSTKSEADLSECREIRARGC